VIYVCVGMGLRAGLLVCACEYALRFVVCVAVGVRAGVGGDGGAGEHGDQLVWTSCWFCCAFAPNVPHPQMVPDNLPFSPTSKGSARQDLGWLPCMYTQVPQSKHRRFTTGY
jgi:hypothetical protein